MARTHLVKKARKDQGRCQSPSCKHPGEPILAGQSYKWFKRKAAYGGIVFKYHSDCKIPQSHRTTSRMGEIWDAQENAEAAIPASPEDDYSTLEQIASDFADIVQDVARGYQESADNMESGFGHSTYQSEELAERANALEDWASDLQSLDFEDFSPEDIEDEVRSILDQEEDESDDDYEERIAAEVSEREDEQRETWWEAQVEVLTDAMSNCPV